MSSISVFIPINISSSELNNASTFLSMVENFFMKGGLRIASSLITQFQKKVGIIMSNNKIIVIGRVIRSRATILMLLLIVLGSLVLSGFFNQPAQAFHTRCHVTGGGNFICAQDGITKITIKMDIFSNFLAKFNSLEVNWIDPGTGVEHQFKEKNFRTGSCYYDSSVTTNTSEVFCNTCDYVGNGELDGNKASFMLSLQDWGEPGDNDRATIVIFSGNNTFISCTSTTGPFNGDIQAYREKLNQLGKNILDGASE